MARKNLQSTKNFSVLNRLLNKYLRIVQIFLLLAVLLLGYYLVIKGRLASIESQRKINIEQKTKILSQMDQALSKFKDLEQAKSQFESNQTDNVKKLDEILPPNSQKYNLIAQIESLITASGFSFPSLSITENLQSSANDQSTGETAADLPAPAGIRTMNINFSVTGGVYQSFKQLLANIEKHVRLFDVSSISFSSPIEEENNYTISIITYYYPLNN